MTKALSNQGRKVSRGTMKKPQRSGWGWWQVVLSLQRADLLLRSGWPKNIWRITRPKNRVFVTK